MCTAIFAERHIQENSPVAERDAVRLPRFLQRKIPIPVSAIAWLVLPAFPEHLLVPGQFLVLFP